MPLPPADKLPLAVRKNVRDEWDNNKAELEKEFSDILGEQWTFEATPNAIWPYHKDGFAKESLGSCIKAYFAGVIWQVKNIVEKDGGDETKKEINSICSAHVVSMDVDESKRFSYCSVDVSPEGKLRILFTPDSLGSNVDYAAQEDQLFPALNNATTSGTTEKKLSFVARHGIRQEWNTKVDEITKSISDKAGKPYELDPNFEETYAKLLEYSKVKKSDLRDDWQSNLGSFTRQYFEGLAWTMQNIKIEDDEMVQEGFNEAIDKSKVVFRIVEKLKKESYCEPEIDGGVLYLQTTAQKWGSNVDYVAQNIMDHL